MSQSVSRCRLFRSSWLAALLIAALATRAFAQGTAAAGDKPADSAAASGDKPAAEKPAEIAKPPEKPKAATIAPGKDVSITIYGFVRLDMNYDTGVLNDTQVPIFATTDDKHATFTLYPRMTRLGLRLDGPKMDDYGDVKFTGLIEFDFYFFPTSDSRDSLRMRHAWVRGQIGGFGFQAGQFAELISPLFPASNHDMVMWHVGNLGDRRPQIMLDYKINADKMSVTTAVSAGLTGAIDGLANANGTLFGEYSGLPTAQALIAFDMKLDDAGKTSIHLDIWAHYARLETQAAINGNTKFDSRAIGFGIKIQPVEMFWFQGEGWIGDALTDSRGGNGQNINSNGEGIKSAGFWLEAGVKPVKELVVVLGYTMDDPRNRDLAPGIAQPTGVTVARSLTSVIYGVVAFTVGPVVYTFEYQHWRTQQVDGNNNNVDRFKFHVQFNF